MRPLTLEQIAKFSGGEAIGSGVVEQITIDSRLATAGSLFVALVGEKGMDMSSCLMCWQKAVLLWSGRVFLTSLG